MCKNQSGSYLDQRWSISNTIRLIQIFHLEYVVYEEFYDLRNDVLDNFEDTFRIWYSRWELRYIR